MIANQIVISKKSLTKFTLLSTTLKNTSNGMRIMKCWRDQSQQGTSITHNSNSIWINMWIIITTLDSTRFRSKIASTICFNRNKSFGISISRSVQFGMLENTLELREFLLVMAQILNLSVLSCFLVHIFS